ncbi:MAG: hypothetical protein RLZZ127_2696 [Planctomycetota bacterium]|jgi:hypothetical protein
MPTETAPPPSDGQELVEAAQRRRRRAPRSRTRATAHDPDAPRPPQRKAEDRATRDTDPVGIPAPPSPRAAAAWLVAAACSAAALLVLCGFAHWHAPVRPAVRAVTWSFADGPRAPKAETDAWLARFPWRDQLGRPDAWVLDRLAAWLAEHPAVERVDRVAWDVAVGAKGPSGHLAVEVALRRPELPVRMADNRAAWLDREGRLLPAALPGPAARRPLVRGIDGDAALRSAVAEAWATISAKVDPALISAIDADAPVDERTRGIVMTTRHGTRILWGRPDDARYGIDPARKAEGLAHVLSSQGDPSRLAEINLRFRRESFRVRD